MLHSIQFKSKTGQLYTIRRITEADHSKIYELVLKDFLKDEPMSKLVPPDQEQIDYLIIRLEILLSQNVSLLAIDLDSGKIAGFAINKIIGEGKDIISPPKIRSPLSQCRARIFNEVNFFKMFHVSVYGEIFILSTLSEYRGQGLGSFLFTESMERLHSSPYNPKVLQVVASSPYTRKIAANLGFKEERIVKFSDFKSDDGRIIIPGLTKENDGELVITSYVYA